MQRTHLLRWLGLAIGLLGTQCLDSISDDCTKTLTCDDAEQPTLQPNCRWEYPDGRVWTGGPAFDRTTNTWRWPDGKPTATQNFQCNLDLPDAGGDGGAAGPDCRDEATPCDLPRVCDEATGACVDCLTNAECAGNMPMGDAGAFTVCDLSIHRCVECVSNENCSGDTPLCKINASNPRRNACVECVGNSDCEDVPATPACDDTTNECTARCESAADCANGEKKACNVTRGLCVECTDSTQCTTEGKGLCDTATNQCVECLDDGPCAADGNVCDLESHTCVQCREDAQCQSRPDAASLPYCDVESRQCVACLNDQQCTTGEASRCNTVLHQCVGCTNSSQCEGGQQCKVGGGAGAAGVCVACLDSDDCSNPDQSFCETTSGRCVECFDSSQCTTADEAHCETSPQASPTTLYTCVSCVNNDDCTGDGKNLPPLCDPNRGGGVCSECTVAEGAADCFGRGPGLSRCQNGLCSVCTVDADCSLHAATTPACRPGVGCVQCTDNADCSDTAATPICKTQPGGGDAAVNTCVQCTTNADCQGNASASLCLDNQCVPCQQDTDCNGVDNNGNAPGGIALNVCDAGTCVQCTGPENGACASGTNVCNSATKQCTTFPVGSADLCQPCVSDKHCAATQRCATHLFDTTPLGPFCFPLATGAATNTCSLTPYSGLTASTTVDGASANLCLLRRTTCSGLADFNAQACDAAADCGEVGLDDGRCDEATETCSIPCTNNIDCFDPGANSCLGGLCQL